MSRLISIVLALASLTLTTVVIRAAFFREAAKTVERSAVGQVPPSESGYVNGVWYPIPGKPLPTHTIIIEAK